MGLGAKRQLLGLEKRQRPSWTEIEPPVNATTALSASLLIYGRRQGKKRYSAEQALPGETMVLRLFFRHKLNYISTPPVWGALAVIGLSGRVC